MPRLIEIERTGVIAPGRASVLDLGVSNLYNATPEHVLYFFEKYPKRPLDDRLRATARDLAERSRPGHPRGHTYLAEVLAETSIDYLALDVFPAPSTRIFDLNFDPVPRDLAGRFDLVLNFGTTEHVFSQYNAFKAVHDFVKVGGHVYHQLPTTGYFNHGYVKYHPRMFEELAVANGYGVVDLFLDTTGCWGFEEFYARLDHFPAPSRFRETVAAAAGVLPAHVNGLLNVFFRKDHAVPFRLMLQVGSADGADPRLAARYASGPPAPPAPPGPPLTPARAAKWLLRTLGVKRGLQALGLR